MGLGGNEHRLQALIICIIHVLFVISLMETICSEEVFPPMDSEKGMLLKH